MPGRACVPSLGAPRFTITGFLERERSDKSCSVHSGPHLRGLEPTKAWRGVLWAAAAH
jgi:hypothetical protein